MAKQIDERVITPPSNIKDDFQTVIDLAWQMISDDGKVNPEDHEQAAAIGRVEEFVRGSRQNKPEQN